LFQVTRKLHPRKTEPLVALRVKFKSQESVEIQRDGKMHPRVFPSPYKKDPFEVSSANLSEDTVYLDSAQNEEFLWVLFSNRERNDVWIAVQRNDSVWGVDPIDFLREASCIEVSDKVAVDGGEEYYMYLSYSNKIYTKTFRKTIGEYGDVILSEKDWELWLTFSEEVFEMTFSSEGVVR
jgi:hypothetical protein